MKVSFRLMAALFASWVITATLGAYLALYLRPFHPSSLQLKQLDIVDAHGAPRISLGLKSADPYIRINSASQMPAIELKTNATTDPSIPIQPAIELNDAEGGSTISISAGQHQRGLIAFESPEGYGGKLLLGNFGVTDDGTDSRLWGMAVRGRLPLNFPSGHMLGVYSVDDKDKGFFWPGDPNPFAK